jgi:cytochrome c oxidase assembly protein subunit 15
MLWLHRYTRLLAASSLLLITAGGLVTSTGSGLSVPDWPNSYGYFMFSFPLSQMVGGVFYEHGHRLIASTVGMMTIGLALWLTRVESRRWVRHLGWLALAAVIAQGILGGITVLFFLPTPVSVSHAGLAQLFFALVVSLAIFTSPGWREGYGRDAPEERAIINDQALRGLALVTPVAIFLQIMVGATMRHTGAGLAIPDFPLAFGRLIPPVWDDGIAIHFAHRVGALAVTTLVIALTGHILAHWRGRTELTKPAVLLLVVVAAQVFLGAWTVLSERDVGVNSTHVATGAALFVTAVALALRVFRERFSDVHDDVAHPGRLRRTDVTFPTATISAPGSRGAEL